MFCNTHVYTLMHVNKKQALNELERLIRSEGKKRRQKKEQQQHSKPELVLLGPVLLLLT